MSPRLLKNSLLFLLLASSMHYVHGHLTQYSQSDPYPVYTTLEPQHFLYTLACEELKGDLTPNYNPERFALSISPFGENADIGKNASNQLVQLGDLAGRWNMLALLLGPTPQGQTLVPTLATAKATMFPNVPLTADIDDDSIFPNNLFARFAIPLLYRKRGLRFEFETRFECDFGLQAQWGLADICQTVTAFNDLTPSSPLVPNSNYPNVNVTNVVNLLMRQLPEIAEDLCYCIDNFHEFSPEDLRLNLFWRNAYPVNEFRPTWPKFLFKPWVTAGAQFNTSKARKYNQAFNVPFGNSGHNSVGCDLGIDIDFYETVEIGMHAGVTHFFSRDVCNFFVPTDEAQVGIFPFKTDVNIQPGNNYHFGIKMNAYHFLERLSFYFEYELILHENDRICLKKPDPAFVPKVLEDRSTWKVQVANMAFNYDISPNISLGFLWQAPLAQRNAYRTTTVMIGFNAIF